MSDKKITIISNLKILASLTPGQTLSTSSMTIIDHNAWSSSLWRSYARENRKDTITFIKGIFIEAVSILKLYPCKELFDNFEPAFKGFLNLKETYKADYYTIAEIDRIIAKCRLDISDLQHISNST